MYCGLGSTMFFYLVNPPFWDIYLERSWCLQTALGNFLRQKQIS